MNLSGDYVNCVADLASGGNNGRRPPPRIEVAHFCFTASDVSSFSTDDDSSTISDVRESWPLKTGSLSTYPNEIHPRKLNEYLDHPMRNMLAAPHLLDDLFFPGKRQLSYYGLTQIVNVCCKHPALATLGVLGGNKVNILGRILQCEATDLTLVQRIVGAVTHPSALRMGSDYSSRNPNHPLNQPASEDGQLPLHVACFTGKLDIVRFLASTAPKALAVADGQGRFPIHIACAVGDKTIIDYLLLQLPDSLTFCDQNGKLPIHIACSRNDGDIIELLASKDPKVLGKLDRDGKLPIDYVLEQRAQREGPPLPTIKQMIKLYPESLAVLQENTRSSALQRLLFRDPVDLEVLKAMVESFPVVAASVSIAPEKPAMEALLMDTCRATELAQLFGKVQSIHLETKHWTQCSFCHFMEQLSLAPGSFRKLSLTVPAYFLSKRLSDTQESFQKAMSQNRFLSELRLDVCQDDKKYRFRETNKDDLLMESLGKALQLRETPLEKLELVNLLFLSTDALVSMLSSEMAPKTVVLVAIEALSCGQQSHVAQGSPSGLQELTIQGIKSSTCNRLLQDIQHSFGNLEEVKVDCDDSLSGSQQAADAVSQMECFGHVLSLLRISPKLASMTIKGCRLDSSRLVEALQVNTSLRRLHLVPCIGSPPLSVSEGIVELLDHHNTTLQDIGPMEPASGGKLQARLEYFLELNKHGRGQARDESCDVEAFVRLLSGVAEGNATIRFGLLLERPGLWSNVIANDDGI